jgi:hypothetical protein
MAPGSNVLSLYEVESHPPLFEEPEPLPGITPLDAKRA